MKNVGFECLFVGVGVVGSLRFKKRVESRYVVVWKRELR